MPGQPNYSSLKSGFDLDGYVHEPSFLAPDELAAVRARVERYQQEIVPTLESYRVLYDVEGEKRSIKQMADLDKSDDYFADWLHHSKARALASTLLGEEVVPHTTEYFDKGPRIGKPTPPHQDGYYFCLIPNHAITLWVALDDCDEENGCMSYVSGSHTRGIIAHNPSGVVGFSQGIDYTPKPEERMFLARGLAGDLFAHHSLTIHLAGPNKSDRHRRSLGLVYFGQSSRRDEQAWSRYKASVDKQRQQFAAGATA